MKLALVALLAVASAGALWRLAASDPTVATPNGAGRASDPSGAAGADEIERLRAELASARAAHETARAELDACRERGLTAGGEVVELRAELEEANTKRLDREREWLRYTQGFAALAGQNGALLPSFEPDVPAEPGPDESAIAAARAAEETARRAGEIFRSLRALLVIEEVGGLDLLESGSLGEGFTGPVVFRALDERGRPLGSISADRLRLESSRSARTITIVLEHGCEKRPGAANPFEGGPPDADGKGGVRRILLPEVDPQPWIEACPELFAPAERESVIDDGRHDLLALRAALNQLLREDALHGWYRVSALGGVQGRVLRDVQIDELDARGALERRLFADRMSCARAENGVSIVLENGAQVRNDRKVAFLDGRYRIFLPRASADAWERAGVPGLEAPAAGDR